MTTSLTRESRECANCGDLHAADGSICDPCYASLWEADIAQRLEERCEPSDPADEAEEEAQREWAIEEAGRQACEILACMAYDARKELLKAAGVR